MTRESTIPPQYKSTDTLIAFIREQERQANVSEQMILDTVLGAESHTHLWAGHKTFEAFVADVFPSRCRRFRQWQKVRKLIPNKKDVAIIGVEAAIRATLIENVKDRRMAVQAMLATARAQNAVVSDVEARRIIKQHGYKPKERNLTSKAESAALKQEIERLKRLVIERDVKIETLTAVISILKSSTETEPMSPPKSSTRNKRSA